jgi:hypothetical protein
LERALNLDFFVRNHAAVEYYCPDPGRPSPFKKLSSIQTHLADLDPFLIVAGTTVSRCVVVSVTINAVPHFQVTNLFYLLHAADISMAGGTSEPGLDMGRMQKLHMIW